MRPWVVSDEHPGLQLTLRQLGREFAGLGRNLWEMIGREQPYAPETDGAIWITPVLVTPSGGTPYYVIPYAVTGGAGADVIIGAARNVLGGDGDDVILPDNTASSERLDGGAGDDFVAGDYGANVLIGGTGDDTLAGGGADDRLYGGGGANLLSGGAGNDWLSVRGLDAHRGGETADAAWIAAKRLVGDGLHGGLGDDTLLGSYGADTLTGGEGADRLDGNDGDDLLVGGGGQDRIDGGDGADRIEDEGEGGAIRGGWGDDVIRVAAGTGSRWTIAGGGGDDAIDCGAGADRVDGGRGADVLRLGAGDDVATAVEGQGAGDDLIFGEAGRDRLSGGFGRDTLDGGAGDDRLHGGARDDLLIGGAGADVFVQRDLGGIDTIADFGPGDRLEIARGVNGLLLEERADLAARAFLGADYAWIDLDGALPAMGPDGGQGIVLRGVEAARLSEILDHFVDIV